ncbi:MAG: hypothetical protein ACKVT0_16940 [Planctomycetaceae bacterium]
MDRPEPTFDNSDSLMFNEHLRREIERGIEQAEKGELEPWDLQATLAEAHKRHGEFHWQNSNRKL